MRKTALISVASLCLAAVSDFAQKPGVEPIYTSAQADAGRTAYEKTCGRCHTLSLKGRQGDPDERPEIQSLSEADRKFIEEYGGFVPPLAGKAFLQNWGSKSASQLVARFQEAKFAFKAAGLNDDEDIVRITAYILQVNGAKAGSKPLTRSTNAIVNSVVE